MSSRDIQDFCKLSPQSEQILRNAITALMLSPRSYHRILKVARTIADLRNNTDIGIEDIMEALSYKKTNLSQHE